MAAGALAAACGPGAGRPSATTAPAALEVFAGDDFYRERAEPEQPVAGVLREFEVVTGPDTRDLPFALDVGGELIPVYSSGFDEEALRRFAGREVVVVGKLVDLSAEGFATELWPATITGR